MNFVSCFKPELKVEITMNKEQATNANYVSPRMFKSDILERMSRVHPTVPLIIFVPVILACLYFSLSLRISQIALFFIGGLAMWTLVEYLMHRFIFHMELKGRIGKRLHFIFHGVHHDYPNDPHRLVMPPSMSIPLSIMFFYLFKVFTGAELIYPFFGGFMLGYLVYDMAHYALHHENYSYFWFRKLKEKHMKHHFLDPESDFGVSNGIWDHVFGTLTKKVKDAKVKSVEI